MDLEAATALVHELALAEIETTKAANRGRGIISKRLEARERRAFAALLAALAPDATRREIAAAVESLMKE